MVRSHQKYSSENLQQATHAYSSGSMSSVDAAKFYGVPESTIRNHKRRPAMNIGSGRPYLLKRNHEDYLVQLLLDLERTGFRLTKKKVMKISQDYVETLKQKSQPLGRRWFHDFLLRNKNKIKFIKEQKLERCRKDGFTETVRSGWFDTLFNVMQPHNLFDKPAQIYNVDECGFNDDTQRELVLVPSDTKIKYEENGGTGKSFTTIIIAVNAKGDVLPPLTVYAAKHVNNQWTEGGPVRSAYCCTDNGWINDEVFAFWFTDVFLMEIPSVLRPVLLVLDGHNCHFTVKVIEAARQNDIIIVCLPPHCTHVKTSWKKIVSSYFERTHRKTIRKIDHPVLLNKLYNRAFTPRQVVAGFTRTGIWPFDRTVMKDKVVNTSRNQLFSIRCPPMSIDNMPLLSNSMLNVSLSNNFDLSSNGGSSSSRYNIQSTSAVPLPTTTNQAIQLLNSVIANIEYRDNENNRGAQQQQRLIHDDVDLAAQNHLLPTPVFSHPNIYSHVNVDQSPSASSSGFSIHQSPVDVVDQHFINDDEQFDLLRSDRGVLQKHTTFSDLSLMQMVKPAMQNESDDDEDEEFLVNSSSRMYTELNNLTLSSIPASSSLSISPSHNSSTATLSTDSNLCLPQLSTPATAAATVYNNLLNTEPRLSSPAPKAPSTRVRQQRKFGEIVTSDSFLEEIKQKEQQKLAKCKSGKSNAN
ncbi:unnamed protein product [Rotaria sp. Silwood2]|nr:unnamed protein product [Rotaria sp. Silwood2]CAF4274635.1 unnamed protein product [Rotaria sp. Silwood2]CAF4508793.1 unnamed protein product [Rotaria sp. Silwood2]CAF4533124.1 unnamed protein product [Rotaria sp. Silwood2]